MNYDMNKRSFIAMSLVMMTAGCATPPPYVIINSLDHNAMKIYATEGSTKVIGQAFLKTRGGDVKFGAGELVFLYPDVPYIHEINSLSQYRLSRAQGIDPKWGSYVRKTTSDGGGNFEFSSISKGNYIIETSVTWEVPTKYGMETQGGTLRTKVTVPESGQVKVIVTER